MRLDLTPLYRSTVGFDRLFQMLDSFSGPNEGPSYPPYNIERTGENAYRITMAVAGFSESDLKLEVKENTLTIRGDKPDRQDSKGQLLFQGIAARSFERRFQLADYVFVQGALLENGLLHIELIRELPEQLKPRTIAIRSSESSKTLTAA